MKNLLSKTVTVAVFAALVAPAVVAPMQIAAARADDGPVLLKRTVNISVYRYLRHWATPTAKTPQYNTWCWIPKMEFQAIGPVPGGSQWLVEFDKPDGSVWVTRACQTVEAAAGETVTVKTPDLDDNKDERIASTAKIGAFPFKIRLKNELAGTNTVMFAGKYNIKTYLPDQSIPEYKNKSEFYIDEDWRLPIGYIWLDPTDNDDAYPVRFTMWFRNLKTGPNLDAVIFKDGKQVAETTSSSQDAELETGITDSLHRYESHTFGISQLRTLQPGKEKPNGYSWTYLNENPGTYQIKVLHDSKVIRSASFTIAADGSIVDNGIASQNHMGGIRMVMPVKVLGTSDGPWNPLSWKTGALYGHPLVGFTAP